MRIYSLMASHLFDLGVGARDGYRGWNALIYNYGAFSTYLPLSCLNYWNQATVDEY